MSYQPTKIQKAYIKEFCRHMNRWAKREAISGTALSDHIICFCKFDPQNIDLARIELLIPKEKNACNAMFENELLFVWDADPSNAFDNAAEIAAYILAFQIES